MQSSSPFSISQPFRIPNVPRIRSEYFSISHALSVMMNFSSFYSFSDDIECPNGPSPSPSLVMFSCFLNGQDPELRESAFRSRDMYKKVKLAQHSPRWAFPGSEPQRRCHRGSAEVSNEPPIPNPYCGFDAITQCTTRFRH